jgi:hypothetical protein
MTDEIVRQAWQAGSALVTGLIARALVPVGPAAAIMMRPAASAPHPANPPNPHQLTTPVNPSATVPVRPQRQRRAPARARDIEPPTLSSGTAQRQRPRRAADAPAGKARHSRRKQQSGKVVGAPGRLVGAEAICVSDSPTP